MRETQCLIWQKGTRMIGGVPYFFESYVRMLHVFYLRYTYILWYIYMELNLYPSWNDRCTYIYPTDVDKTRSCVDFLYCTILDLSIIISITKSRKRQIHVLNAIAQGLETTAVRPLSETEMQPTTALPYSDTQWPENKLRVSYNRNHIILTLHGAYL